MEADGSAAAGEGTGSTTSSDNTNPSKKIFRAKKTMTASCRQQIVALNKIMKSSKTENTANETFDFFPNPPLEQTSICKTNYFAQDSANLSKSLAFENQGLFPNALKVSIEVSQVDSGINIGCSYNETFSTWSSIENKQGDGSSHPVSSDVGSIHISHTECFVVENSETPLSESLIDNLKQSQTKAGSPSVEPKCSEPPSPSDTVDYKSLNSVDQSISEASVAVLAELKTPFEDNTIPNDDVLDEDANLGIKRTVTCDLNVTADTTGLEDKLTVALATTDINTSLTNGFNLNLSNNSTPPDNLINFSAVHGKRKRSRSESDDLGNSKRTKPSDKSWPAFEQNKVILEQIRLLTESRLERYFKEAFDQRMEDLMKRVNRIQCKQNYIDDVARCIKKIRKLEKRIMSAISIQKEQMLPHKNMQPVTSGTKKDLISIKKENVAASKPPSPSKTPVTPLLPNSRSGKLNASCTDLIVRGDNESNEETSSVNRPANDTGVVVQSPKPSDALAAHNMAETLQAKEAAPPNKISLQDKRKSTVTDFTAVKEQKDIKDIKLEDKSSPSCQSLGVTPNSLGKPSEAKSVTAENSLGKDVADGTSPTAQLSITQKSKRPEQNPADKSLTEKPLTLSETLKASYEQNIADKMLSFQPPQKPELRLTQVKNPKGIALSWDVPSVDPKCAAPNTYCLYVLQDNPQSTKILWKKIGEIKALPLPMACTLTHFVEGTKYSFTLRARDRYGRFGPLSDIQSTTLLPSPESKAI
ncbi:activating transcription factor 7-interacting protein 2 isoform X2 [Bombina bombina]|uniref:activating transcription factor 7-interacting protein 2 isoform X2 n=1 Tax=Bombina bombina TaxID=8345 RepID=UPI00235B2961|nr:activating transcription factor 7-interacting protein 2 isoform X2 [Bombina bombina]